MEIDIWVPSCRVGFEYQDESHFSDVLYGKAALQDTLVRDAEKRRAAKRCGIKLVEVTCKKWSGDVAYIERLITAKRLPCRKKSP